MSIVKVVDKIYRIFDGHKVLLIEFIQEYKYDNVYFT